MLDSIFLSSQSQSIKQFQSKIFSIEKNSQSNEPLFEKFLQEFFKYIPLDYVGANNHLDFWQFAKQAYVFALKKSSGEKKLQIEYCRKNNRLTICAINSIQITGQFKK